MLTLPFKTGIARRIPKYSLELDPDTLLAFCLPPSLHSAVKLLTPTGVELGVSNTMLQISKTD